MDGQGRLLGRSGIWVCWKTTVHSLLTGLFQVTPLITLWWNGSPIWFFSALLSATTSYSCIPWLHSLFFLFLFFLRDTIFVYSFEYLPGQVTLNPEFEPKLTLILHPRSPACRTSSSQWTCLSPHNAQSRSCPPFLLHSLSFFFFPQWLLNTYYVLGATVLFCFLDLESQNRFYVSLTSHV